ncbi:MAG: DUF2092 domain-containing protein [Phycisphaerae bacterium]|nr:DUF2092 domain-containing protein [Phycisphaerae bacterium]
MRYAPRQPTYPRPMQPIEPSRPRYYRPPADYGSVRQRPTPTVLPARGTYFELPQMPRPAQLPARRPPRPPVDRLPDGCAKALIAGKLYYRHHHKYYWPYYYAGGLWYYEVYPPEGAYVEDLPPEYETEDVDGRTYYRDDGDTYYTKGQQEGKDGYVVVPPPEGASSKPAEAPAAQVATPDPLAILMQMSKHLAQLDRFIMGASETIEMVTESGQKIEVANERTIYVQRPNAVVADAKGDEIDKRVWYDGKTLTVLDRASNLYSRIETPGTIDATLDMLHKRYGMTLPLADLFYADVFGSHADRIGRGTYVGEHKVGPHTCHHLAFSKESIDWEIWIQTGDRPWPRKLAIHYKNETSEPRYTATIERWNPSPAFEKDLFTFKAPDGAQQIEMLPIGAPKDGADNPAAP